MLECTSASDPYATYPSLSERIGINVSAVRKLIDGMVTLHLSYTIIFFLFLLPLCHQHRRNPLYKGEAGVVAARWEVAAKPHPRPLPEREGSGCACFYSSSSHSLTF